MGAGCRRYPVAGVAAQAALGESGTADPRPRTLHPSPRPPVEGEMRQRKVCSGIAVSFSLWFCSGSVRFMGYFPSIFYLSMYLMGYENA